MPKRVIPEFVDPLEEFLEGLDEHDRKSNKHFHRRDSAPPRPDPVVGQLDPNATPTEETWIDAIMTAGKMVVGGSSADTMRRHMVKCALTARRIWSAAATEEMGNLDFSHSIDYKLHKLKYCKKCLCRKVSLCKECHYVKSVSLRARHFKYSPGHNNYDVSFGEAFVDETGVAAMMVGAEGKGLQRERGVKVLGVVQRLRVWGADESSHGGEVMEVPSLVYAKRKGQTKLHGDFKFPPAYFDAAVTLSLLTPLLTTLHALSNFNGATSILLLVCDWACESLMIWLSCLVVLSGYRVALLPRRCMVHSLALASAEAMSAAMRTCGFASSTPWREWLRLSLRALSANKTEAVEIVCAWVVNNCEWEQGVGGGGQGVGVVGGGGQLAHGWSAVVGLLRAVVGGASQEGYSEESKKKRKKVEKLISGLSVFDITPPTPHQLGVARATISHSFATNIEAQEEFRKYVTIIIQLLKDVNTARWLTLGMQSALLIIVRAICPSLVRELFVRLATRQPDGTKTMYVGGGEHVGIDSLEEDTSEKFMYNTQLCINALCFCAPPDACVRAAMRKAMGKTKYDNARCSALYMQQMSAVVGEWRTHSQAFVTACKFAGINTTEYQGQRDRGILARKLGLAAMFSSWKSQQHNHDDRFQEAGDILGEHTDGLQPLDATIQKLELLHTQVDQCQDMGLNVFLSAVSDDMLHSATASRHVASRHRATLCRVAKWGKRDSTEVR